MQDFTSRFGAKTLAVAAGILAAMGVSAFAISSPFSDGKTVEAVTSSPPAASSAPPVQRATSVDPRLAAMFAIFRGTRTSADELPSRIATRLDSDEFGSSPTLARRAGAVDAHTTVFAVPARDRVCLIVLESDGQSTSTCQPIDNAVGRGMFITAYCAERSIPSKVQIYGLAPDNVSTVDVRQAGRVVAQAQVQGNAFTAKSSGADSITIGNSTQELGGGPRSC